MSTDVMIMVLIFVSTIIGLVKFPNNAAQVFCSSLLAVFLLGYVDEQTVVNSFTNIGLLVLVMLLLASVAIEKTSVIRWLTGKIESSSYFFSWLKLFITTALGSAFLNNTAVVSTLIRPIRNNPKIAASRLLIPLSYAAILGGTLTLIGTSTNLIVNSMYVEATGESLDFFVFLPVGICALAVTSVAIFGISKFLPNQALANPEVQKYVIETKLAVESKLVGKSVQDAGLRHLESLFLVEIIRDKKVYSPVSPEEVLEAGDRLLFSGDINQVSQLEQFEGLDIVVESNTVDLEDLTEVVIRPDSPLVRSTLKASQFRSKFDAAVIAVKRDGASLSGKLGELRLKAGDYLVLVTGRDFHKRHNVKKNFIILSGVQPEHKLSGWREWFAVLGFLAVIVSAGLGLFSLFKGLAVLLIVMVLTGCMTSQDIKQRMPYQIWVIVGSAIVLSQAMTNTGTLSYFLGMVDFDVQSVSNEVSNTIASSTSAVLGLDNWVWPPGFLMLVTVFFITLILTELVTNNAAAALMFPIAYSIPMSSSMDVMPFVLGVAFAASSSFISPYSYQTNLMVYNAGQYRLKDFAKAGLPVSLTYSISVLTTLYYFYFL